MLARNYLDAKQLGITEIERTSLIDVLHRMERKELVSYADSGGVTRSNTIYMPTFFSENLECGTIGCLAGWAHIISNGEAFPEIKDAIGEIAEILKKRIPKALCDVFGIDVPLFYLQTASTETLANSLREYLTTGNVET